MEDGLLRRGHLPAGQFEPEYLGEPVGRLEGDTDSIISRMTRQGLPAAKTPSGMSRVTTLPAPMTEREPIWTPGQMMAPPPTQTSEPISMGLANSGYRPDCC